MEEADLHIGGSDCIDLAVLRIAAVLHIEGFAHIALEVLRIEAARTAVVDILVVVARML